MSNTNTNSATISVADKTNDFKKELKELLAKYNADIWVQLDGDTHGVSSALLIDIDNKTILTNQTGCISHYDITIPQPEPKYSKETFEGFTHRFIVKLCVDNDSRNDINLTLYSNSDSYVDLEKFINEKKSEKLLSFEITHRASKEDDELAGQFIDEILTKI